MKQQRSQRKGFTERLLSALNESSASSFASFLGIFAFADFVDSANEE